MIIIHSIGYVNIPKTVNIIKTHMMLNRTCKKCIFGPVVVVKF